MVMLSIFTFQDVDTYIPRFYDSPDIRRDIEGVVTEQGLEIITIEERKQTVSFPNMQVLMSKFDIRAVGFTLAYRLLIFLNKNIRVQ